VDEREVDRLYGLPLEEFTTERNELAKRLRGAGDREAADEVKRLTKPTVPVWLVNQLARTNEVPMRALLRSGDKLRDAQRTVLAGGDADDLREAQREERDVVARLTAQARKLMPKVTSSALERVAETLRAAAVADDETRDLLKRGRLTEELELSGFTALAGMPVGDRTRRERPKGAPRDDARERVKEARAAAREADKEAKRLEREAAKAREAADTAAAELAQAEDDLATASS
jgi:hypothetical protein